MSTVNYQLFILAASECDRKLSLGMGEAFGHEIQTGKQELSPKCFTPTVGSIFDSSFFLLPSSLFLLPSSFAL
jgi:hypothetical protein